MEQITLRSLTERLCALYDKAIQFIFKERE